MRQLCFVKLFVRSVSCEEPKMKKDMNSELNSLIEQWKNSSPYAQERLQLLKKIINLNGENKLYRS